MAGTTNSLPPDGRSAKTAAHRIAGRIFLFLAVAFNASPFLVWWAYYKPHGEMGNIWLVFAMLLVVPPCAGGGLAFAILAARRIRWLPGRILACALMGIDLLVLGLLAWDSWSRCF